MHNPGSNPGRSCDNLPISSSTGQHFVDSQNVEGMHTDTNMELILGGMFYHVLQNENSRKIRFHEIFHVKKRNFLGVFRKKLEYL